jgi:hypothetical protein
MKKVLFLITGLTLLSLLLTVTACDNLTPTKGSADNNTHESEFNFIFKYGFSGRNTLDTFKGTYTKDMGMDPAITIPLPLTEENKDRIHQKMIEIDFFNYPDKFSVVVPTGELETRVMPYSTYFFKVTYDGHNKELLWHEKVTNSEEKADKLRELITLIRGIIESREEYKKLPAPRGGYS